ncbi:MAG: V-type ATP synthase subunit F [Pelolinea sp.]|nr:V-type ATP synthase subunit F [Pelolinea sp.]
MNKMVVITRKDQAHGFKLAGVDAIGVDDIETVHRIITAWLNKKEQILLAIDDGLFSQLDKVLVKRMYASNDMHLVTIPDGPISDAGASHKQSIYDMIRHATGVQIRFKGEMDGTKG